MFISFGSPVLSSSGICTLLLHVFEPVCTDVQYKAVIMVVAHVHRAGLLWRQSSIGAVITAARQQVS